MAAIMIAATTIAIVDGTVQPSRGSGEINAGMEGGRGQMRPSPYYMLERLFQEEGKLVALASEMPRLFSLIPVCRLGRSGKADRRDVAT